jgi:GTPase SAR1 family protein
MDNQNQPTIIFYGPVSSGKTAYLATLYQSSNQDLNISGNDMETVTWLNSINNLLEKGILPDKTLSGQNMFRPKMLKLQTKDFRINMSFFDLDGETITQHSGQNIEGINTKFVGQLDEKLKNAIGICYLIPYSNQRSKYEHLLPDALDLALSQNPNIPFSILVTKMDMKYPQKTLSEIDPNTVYQDATRFLEENYTLIFNKLKHRNSWKLFPTSILNTFICTQNQKSSFIESLKEHLVYRPPVQSGYILEHRKISAYQVREPIIWILNESYQQKLKFLEKEMYLNQLDDTLNQILRLSTYYEYEHYSNSHEKYNSLKQKINQYIIKNKVVILNSKINDTKLFEKNLGCLELKNILSGEASIILNSAFKKNTRCFGFQRYMFTLLFFYIFYHIFSFTKYYI